MMALATSATSGESADKKSHTCDILNLKSDALSMVQLLYKLLLGFFLTWLI